MYIYEYFGLSKIIYFCCCQAILTLYSHFNITLPAISNKSNLNSCTIFQTEHSYKRCVLIIVNGFITLFSSYFEYRDLTSFPFKTNILHLRRSSQYF